VNESGRPATKDRHRKLLDSSRGRTTILAVHSDEEFFYVRLQPASCRQPPRQGRGQALEFFNTPTGGFAAGDDVNVAVCLLPGTEIAFEQDVECEPALGIFPGRKLGQRLARFRQINMDQPCVHHDALEFPDGKIVLVTRLCEGQRATVLQMPAAARSPRPASEAAAERPLSFVE